VAHAVYTVYTVFVHTYTYDSPSIQLLERVYRHESAGGSILNPYKVFRKHTNGFLQHLEPCVGNNSVVFPPHMRSVKTNDTEAIFE
jgi:hypothetical protein